MGGSRMTTSIRLRAGVERGIEFRKNGKIRIGIDPGARYTGFVVRDGDVPIHASTITRPIEDDAVTYARYVVAILVPLVEEYKALYPNLRIGIEGISDPKGFKHGKRASLDPKHIIRTGVTAGALAIAFPDAVIIPPGNNGSQHISQYPAELQGRRPASLAGDSNKAGTRSHEQSAYDIAGKVF